MDEVLINTKADMRWLRDVHLPKGTLDHGYPGYVRPEQTRSLCEGKINMDKEELTTLLGELGGKIKDLLVAGGKGFLDEKAIEGREFLKSEVADAAYWTIQLAQAKDDAQAAAVKAQLERVRDRVVDALWAAAVDASKETRGTLKVIATTIFEYAVQVLPKIIGIVASA